MNLIMMSSCQIMLVGAGRTHYRCFGGRTPLDQKDDTTVEASLRRGPSYFSSWLVPAADSRSAWDAPKRSQLSEGDGPPQIPSLRTMEARSERLVTQR